MTLPQSLSEGLAYPALRHTPERVQVTTEAMREIKMAMANAYGVYPELLDTFCGVPIKVDDSIRPALVRIIWEERMIPVSAESGHFPNA